MRPDCGLDWLPGESAKLSVGHPLSTLRLWEVAVHAEGTPPSAHIFMYQASSVFIIPQMLLITSQQSYSQIFQYPGMQSLLSKRLKSMENFWVLLFPPLGIKFSLTNVLFSHIKPWQNKKDNKKTAGNFCIYQVIWYHCQLSYQPIHSLIFVPCSEHTRKKSFLLFYLFFKSLSLLYLIITEGLPIFYMYSFSMRVHRKLFISSFIHLLS